MQRYRMGVAGVGAAGRAFLPAIRRHPGYELAAFADPVADIRDSVAADTGIAGYADLPAMLEGAALDAVYIATPTDLHPEHAALAFRAGKHVLIEKPMAVRLDQARTMIAQARSAGVMLLVGHGLPARADTACGATPCSERIPASICA